MNSFSPGKINIYFSILRWNTWKPILQWNNFFFFNHNSDIFFLRIASLHVTDKTFVIQMIKFRVYIPLNIAFYLLISLFIYWLFESPSFFFCNNCKFISHNSTSLHQPNTSPMFLASLFVCFLFLFFCKEIEKG